MATIQLTTTIKAPIERCFNLSRSIDLHMESTGKTGERAIAGRTSGLIEHNETVTWRAKHLGVWQQLTSKITEYEYPVYFVDEMVSGAFKSFRHEHHFMADKDATIMKDMFVFESPFGLLGKWFNQLFLKKYLTGFLAGRNLVIKEYAEGEKWKILLEKSNR